MDYVLLPKLKNKKFYLLIIPITVFFIVFFFSPAVNIFDIPKQKQFENFEVHFQPRNVVLVPTPYTPNDDDFDESELIKNANEQISNTINDSLSPIIFSWNQKNSTEITSKIERKTGENGEYVTIAEGIPYTITEFNDVVRTGPVYYYRVYTVNPGGQSEPLEFHVNTIPSFAVNQNWNEISKELKVEKFKLERKIDNHNYTVIGIFNATQVTYSDMLVVGTENIESGSIVTYRLSAFLKDDEIVTIFNQIVIPPIMIQK